MLIGAIMRKTKAVTTSGRFTFLATVNDREIRVTVVDRTNQPGTLKVSFIAGIAPINPLKSIESNLITAINETANEYNFPANHRVIRLRSNGVSQRIVSKIPHFFSK
jgi:hypothetical protein